ncbi:aminotransferase class I/II-fold pyridoxal phosphate-dependent enzyme [Bacillus salitolerans]|uniref:Aminotransferase class I/II-fold pyridoxal phosphate-dependent enzyme n=1 Tax=Bacillus salitolerans TaxID=1437434 RepID=A0ABW4LP44_9BACI
MNQKSTPLLSALISHHNQQPTSFHVPGHKYGRFFPEIGQSYYEKILSIDVTELTGLDDLHDPSGPIYEAEKLLSNLYDSERSFFLVNGSTVGNLAMVLSVCEANDIVFVQRNCHKSIMNALEIVGARPVFLTPEFESELNVATYLDDETVIQAFSRYPKGKALILTNPNYYGHTRNLESLISIAHDYHIPVLVDEAHGAHFGIGSPFPPSAIQVGADIVIQSAHKTLPAMTMGSYLHFQSSYVSLEKLQFYLRALQSSSPSYPIMASLDLARYYVANIMENERENIHQSIKNFTNQIDHIPQLKLVYANDGNLMQDPLKITVQSTCQLSGYELQTIFEEKGLYVELSDPFNILLILPLGVFDYSYQLQNIKDALSYFHPVDSREKYVRDIKNLTLSSEFPYSYLELKRYKTRKMNIADCEGRLAAQAVTPYPPGIPVLIKGEIVKRESIEYIMLLKRMGAKIQGFDPDNNMFIFEEQEES